MCRRELITKAKIAIYYNAKMKKKLSTISLDY